MPARVMATLLLFCGACTRRNYRLASRDEIWDDVEKARPEGEGRGSTGQGARARERPAPVAGSGRARCWRSKKKTSDAGDPPESTRKRRDRLIVARGAGGADPDGGRRGSGRGSLHAVSRQLVKTEASSSAVTRPSARRSSEPCTVSGSSTRRPPRCGPRFWTREPTSARFARCIGFWRSTARSGSAGTNGAIRTTPSRSCWPKRPTRFGRGILRSFVAPSSGRHPRHLLPLRGWLDAGSPRKCTRSPNASSPRAVASRTLNPTSSPFTRIVAAR